MNKLLFLPGLLFLIVIFFRVVLPLLKSPAWKRLLDSARYERARKNPEKSDRLLLKAVAKFPDRPEVYLEYYLNHSDSADLGARFEVLKAGYERTGDVPLSFFIGSAWLEEGDFEKAAELLEKEEVTSFIREKHILILPLLHLERGDYEKAEETFWDFHRVNSADEKAKTELLGTMSAQDIITLVIIRRAAGGQWLEVMQHVPLRTIHSDMSWEDYRHQLEESLEKLKPARTGIAGAPDRFNRRREAFFKERMTVVDEGIKSLETSRG